MVEITRINFDESGGIGSRLLNGSGSVSSGMNINRNEKKLWKFPEKIVGADRPGQKFNVYAAQFPPHNNR